MDNVRKYIDRLNFEMKKYNSKFLADYGGLTAKSLELALQQKQIVELVKKSLPDLTKVRQQHIIQQATFERLYRNMSGIGYDLLQGVIEKYESKGAKSASGETDLSRMSFDKSIPIVFDEVIAKIDELVKSNQTKPLIQNGWVQVFLSLIFTFLFSYKSDLFIESKFYEQGELIENAKRQIIEKIDSITEKSVWTEKEIDRPTSVFLKKSNRSQRISKLFSGDTVRLIKPEKKWAYIEFFDYNDGLPKYGWVMKKHLRKGQSTNNDK